MNIFNFKNQDPERSIRDYLIINGYDNFFYVGNKTFFAFNSTEIHLYDKVWYKYYDHKKAMYVPFKINNNLVKLKIASTHTVNLYS